VHAVHSGRLPDRAIAPRRSGVATDPVRDHDDRLGERCDPPDALHAFKAAAKRGAANHGGCTTLRHSAASMMLSAGVPLDVISGGLGAT